MNLDVSVFNDYKEIVKFIHDYEPNMKLTTNIIAQLKRRPVKPKKLYKDDVVDNFINYVKIKFPNFDSEMFYNEYSNSGGV